jgi:hypothetical protein
MSHKKEVVILLGTTTPLIPFRIVGIIKEIQVYNKIPIGC